MEKTLLDAVNEVFEKVKVQPTTYLCQDKLWINIMNRRLVSLCTFIYEYIL